MSFKNFYIIESSLKKKEEQIEPDEFYEIDLEDNYEVENEDDPDSLYIDLPEDENDIVLYVIDDDELNDGDEIGGIQESYLLTESIKRKIVIKNGKKKIRFFSTMRGYKIVRIGNSVREVRTKASETRKRSKSAKRTAIKTAGKQTMKNLKAKKTNRIRKILIRVKRR